MKAPFSTTAKAIKRITLDDLYTAIDDVKNRQEEDYRFLNVKLDTISTHLNQKIDIQVGQIRQEIGQLNQKIDTQIGGIRQEIGQLNQRIDNLGQKMDTQFAQLNQTILQFIMGKQKG